MKNNLILVVIFFLTSYSTAIGQECTVCNGEGLTHSHSSHKYKCSTCSGSGRCSTCGGDGQMACWDHDSNRDGYCTICNNAGITECYDCFGGGKCKGCNGYGTEVRSHTSSKTCSNCNGKGFFTKAKRGRSGYTEILARRYKWVELGDQIWLAEDLKYEFDAVKNIKYIVKGTSSEGTYYSYKSITENKNIIHNSELWHLPSKYDWQKLINYCGSEKAVSVLLAEDGELEFDLGNGYYFWSSDYSGEFGKSKTAWYWTSNAINSGGNTGHCIMIRENGKHEFRYRDGKEYGYSIRLVCNKSDFFKSLRYGIMKTPDGKIYKTVKIGEKEWMAEDLCFKINGATSYIKNDRVTYNNMYYTIEAAKKVADKIPGWHLPSEAEWDKVISQHKKLKIKYSGYMYGYRSGKLDDGNGYGKFSIYWSSTTFFEKETDWEGNIVKVPYTYKYSIDPSRSRIVEKEYQSPGEIDEYYYSVRLVKDK